MECQFYEPLYWKRGEQIYSAPDGDEWSESYKYSKMVCSDVPSELYELITNETTTASFYLEKSFSYGDFFVMGILTLFVLVKIVEVIWNKFLKN